MTIVWCCFVSWWPITSQIWQPVVVLQSGACIITKCVDQPRKSTAAALHVNANPANIQTLLLKLRTSLLCRSTIVTILGVITIASIIKIIRNLVAKGKTEWTNRNSKVHHPLVLQKPASQSASAVSSMAAQSGPQAKKTK
eukprot:TRINITY_DN672_c0_g1_i2.p1 TRINITY_DN672_c0_g1~~TRINITY_DN672_c0_g1_i2.p1  ORF type:complete len:140 (+),score=5.54 TRINITY_DN672_c0_g1_i2:1855-2274(+)